MSRSQKPVFIVALILVALIVVPLLLLVLSRLGEGGVLERNGDVTGRSVAAPGVGDYELRQLVSRADQLIEENIAEALRKNEVSLSFMSDLKREADRAAEALNRGRLDQARERYEQVVAVAEARLAALALADKARDMDAATFAELERLESLKGSFENAYREAVERYNLGASARGTGSYQGAVDDFEMSQAILGDLEARFIQQIGNLLETGKEALAEYELEAAGQAYASVLDLDPDNEDAREGLSMVDSLEGISDAVQAIRDLERAGQLEEAFGALERLAELKPNNPFVRTKGAALQARIAERDFLELVAQSKAEEAAGHLERAITALEAGLAIQSSAEQSARLENLKKRYKEERLERLLSDGYDALAGGRFESARNYYREAVALAAKSQEARTGLERASSLYLANIRYSQNLAGASRRIEEGRFPLAANLFNEALATRPSVVEPKQAVAEARIRGILEVQSKEVAVTIRSDRRTFVSIIGVIPPERFRVTELKLFPDVYRVRGTRPGYAAVEVEVKVDANQPNLTVVIECTERL